MQLLSYLDRVVSTNKEDDADDLAALRAMILDERVPVSRVADALRHTARCRAGTAAAIWPNPSPKRHS